MRGKKDSGFPDTLPLVNRLLDPLPIMPWLFRLSASTCARLLLPTDTTLALGRLDRICVCNSTVYVSCVNE
ncbi:hypothetical protein M378DRAFT_922464 [Amanita muscaria Koide BX008]|uniref:Uncharacterized protein n=1 Tax=Amanita muscaria (strain Koide BX008) TaxID=946122 RepID=A0A0C2SBU1_AMAMK|nr:hypothetical protein M378DRAFT_922464 [Amanita muscaria Koide BX008]